MVIENCNLYTEIGKNDLKIIHFQEFFQKFVRYNGNLAKILDALFHKKCAL